MTPHQLLVPGEVELTCTLQTKIARQCLRESRPADAQTHGITEELLAPLVVAEHEDLSKRFLASGRLAAPVRQRRENGIHDLLELLHQVVHLGPMERVEEVS